MEKEKSRWVTTNSILILVIVSLFSSMIIIPCEQVEAGSYNGSDLANAILADPTTLLSSSYWDTDSSGTRQSTVLSSLGTMLPTDGSTFALFSTGIAGANPVTTYTTNPGDESGTWFGVRKPAWYQAFDEAELTMQLEVPLYMHYLYYDVQFFTSEYPDYIGTIYNDKLTVSVNSPSEGISTHVIDVNGGDFVLNSHDIPGTGYDIFAINKYTGEKTSPADVDWVQTTPGVPGADGGATALVSREHAVSPGETITVTINIKDAGDNIFDSTAFIDNMMFSGFAKTDILARKTVEDLDGGDVEPEDILEYHITLSNIGTVTQPNNGGNEFEDIIPENTTYVDGSAQAGSGAISYDSGNNMITWNGQISAESSVALSFQVAIDIGIPNGVEISNQGTVNWDSNEDGVNDAIELTDDPSIDDGIDQDGDGETDDDDPTVVSVTSFELPSELIEEFDDDTPGGSASQSYQGNTWFETTYKEGEGNFEVASGYYYSSTPQSFKMKLRSSCGNQFWNYSLGSLLCEMNSWESWFACGNTSEAYTLTADFKNEGGTSLAQIKLGYTQEGTEDPTDYILKLYYRTPAMEWELLSSAYPGGYLYNGWYKLKLEQTDTNQITYTLYQNGIGIVSTGIEQTLSGGTFSDIQRVVFSTSYEPVVCPMFFWDEHKIGIHPLS